MKFTPTLFLAAAGLLTLAVAVPRRVEPPKQTLPLDGDGIVALRVEADSLIDVDLDYEPDCDCRRGEPRADRAPKTPHVRWPSDGVGDVSVRRDGSTLVLVATGLEDGATINVMPPAGVRHFDIPAGNVHSNEPLPATTVHVRGDFTWSASAEALDVIQEPTEACLAADFCRVQVRIGGAIGDVRVQAGQADVDLTSPDRIGRAVVRLAPRADVTVSDARRIDNVTIEYVDFDSRALTADEAAEVRAAALAADDESDEPTAAEVLMP